MSVVPLDSIWPEVQNGMKSILALRPMNSQGWFQLYTSVYNYCTRGPKDPHSNQAGATYIGEELYLRVQKLLIEHTGEILKNAQGHREEQLLVYYRKEWNQFEAAMNKLDHIFSYLNKNWIKNAIEHQKKADVFDIYTLSLVKWRDTLFVQLKDQLKRELLSLIEKDRNGEMVETDLISTVLQSYVRISKSSLISSQQTRDTKKKAEEMTLDVYKSHFEEDFLHETEVYYTREASNFLSMNPVDEYMKKVETRLQQESLRVEKYLHESTRKDLISKCEQVLIQKHKERMHSEFTNLVERDKVLDLGRMYTLLSKVDALDPMKVAFEQHVLKHGESEIEAVAKQAIDDPKIYVEALLKIYNRYNSFVTGPFQTEPGFVQALDKACRKFINDNAVCRLAKALSKSPELLAKYSDILLRSRKIQENELEQNLKDVLTLFKYIEERDVFITFYSKFLAKRLIHGLSVSQDTEDSMIAKLKIVCGWEHTAKLMRMVQDMMLNNDLNARFKSSIEEKKENLLIGNDNFSVLVLSFGTWPFPEASTNFAFPKELQACTSVFEKFYSDQNSAKQVIWLPHLCKGELKGTTSTKKYLYQCSLYQMGVLLQFNDQPTMTLKDLQEATQLVESTLGTQLRILIQQGVLMVTPALGEITDNFLSTHQFSVNKEFKSKSMKVNLNQPLKVKGAAKSEAGPNPEDEQTRTQIEEERKLYTQAAIVRIMKARKELLHNLLIKEVIEQLSARFKPQPLMIRKAIDLMIEKEYLERSPDNKQLYRYLA